MKRLSFMSIAILALSISAMHAVAGGREVTGTISEIDCKDGKISVTDDVGVRWNYKVMDDAGVDLSRFQKGDRVTVSVARATPLNMMSAADYVRKGDTIVKMPGIPY